MPFEGHLMYYKRFYCLCAKKVKYNVRSQLQRSDVICEQIPAEGLLYDAERNLLAIAEFLY